MSAEDVVHRLQYEIRHLNYDFEDKVTYSGLTSMFESFDTETLVEANETSGGVLFRTFSQVAISAAKYRSQKFPKMHPRLTLSDFVPAFAYISSMGRQKQQFRKVYDVFRRNGWPDRMNLFRKDVVEMVRNCCPWC